MPRPDRIARVAAVLLLALPVPGAALAATDSTVNPQTGQIETVSEHWNGSNLDLIYTIHRTPLPSVTFGLVTGSTEDADPRLSIRPSGDVTVVWTREGSPAGVYARSRSFASQQMGTIRLVSASGEESRGAAIAFDGTDSWAAYEVHESGGVSIGAVRMTDEPNPYPQRTIVSGTAWSGPYDVRLLAEAGHLWMTWRDDATHVGSSEYDAGTEFWGAAAFQAVSGSDLDGAYEEIRQSVLNP